VQQVITVPYFKPSGLTTTWNASFLGLTDTSSTVLPGGKRVVMTGGMIVIGSVVETNSFLFSIGEFIDENTWQWTSFSPGSPIFTFGTPIVAFE
jgi:hypothetical protein